MFLARRSARKFLRWAMATRLMPRSKIPHRDTVNPAPIGLDRRMERLSRAAEDEEPDLLDRAVVVPALLFEPFSRTCRLTPDDLADLAEQGGRLSLRFGGPPTPVP